MKKQEYIKPFIEAYTIQTESFIAYSPNLGSDEDTGLGNGGDATEGNEPEGGFSPEKKKKKVY